MSFPNVISNCLTTTNTMLYCIVVLAEVSQTHTSKSWQVLPNYLHHWLYTTRGLLFCNLGEVTLLLQTACPPRGGGPGGGSSTGFKPTLKCNICLSTGRHPTAFGVPGRTYRVEECPAGFCRDGHMAGRVQ